MLILERQSIHSIVCDIESSVTLIKLFPYDNLTWPEVRGDKSPAQYVEVPADWGKPSTNEKPRINEHGRAVTSKTFVGIAPTLHIGGGSSA